MIAGPAPQAAQAFLSVDATERDFGVVKQETGLLQHTFTFLNHGPTPVRLRPTYIGCACLAVACPEEVAPHSSAPMKIDLEIRTREGDFSTRVLLETSDPAVPQMELRLKFYAQPPIKVDPPSLQFTDLARGEMVERELRVITQLEAGDHPVPPDARVSAAGVECRHLETKRLGAPRGGLPRVMHRYQVRLDSGALPAASSSGWSGIISLRLPDAPEDTAVQLPIEVTFRHHAWLKGQTSLTLHGAQKGRTMRVRLWSINGKSFSLAKVESSIPELEAKVADTALASTQDVLITLSPDAKLAGTRYGFLSIVPAQPTGDPYRLEVLLLP
jgi:hypothetical protein